MESVHETVNGLDSFSQKDTNPFLCSICGEKECSSKPLVKCEGCKQHLHLQCGGYEHPVCHHVVDSLYWTWRCRECFNRSSMCLPCDNGGQERESFYLKALQQMEARLLARIDELSIILTNEVTKKNGGEQATLTGETQSSRDRLRKASADAPCSSNGSSSCAAGDALSVRSEVPTLADSSGGSDLLAPAVNINSNVTTDSLTVRKKARKNRSRRKKSNAHPQSSGSSASSTSLVTPQIDAMGTAVLNTLKATFASVLANDKTRGNTRVGVDKQGGSIVGTRQRSETQLRAISREVSADDKFDLFVTRLVPDTTIECVRKHILACTGIRVVVSKLRTRYDSYASFRVSSQRNCHTLLNPDLWPKGVLVQKYRGRSEQSTNVPPIGSRRA